MAGRCLPESSGVDGNCYGQIITGIREYNHAILPCYSPSLPLMLSLAPIASSPGTYAQGHVISSFHEA